MSFNTTRRIGELNAEPLVSRVWPSKFIEEMAANPLLHLQIATGALKACAVTTDSGSGFCRRHDVMSAFMDAQDRVDPADAAIHALLGHIADNAKDPQKRERILDLMVTVPPVVEWPPEAIDQWRDIFHYVRSLRRDVEERELNRLYETSGNDHDSN